MPAPCLAHQGVLIRLAMVVAIALSSSSPLWASDYPRSFDIRAQPLTVALVQFADRTGMAALVDGDAVDGKTSTAVKGRLVPQEALRILLAGTGLSFRRVGDTAFSVGPNTIRPAGDGQSAARHTGDFNNYFARIQDTIERSICSDAYLRSTPYRAVVQVWIGAAGAVDAIHRVSASGDELLATIARTRVAPPPLGLPQPVTLILQRGETDTVTCAK